MGHLHDALHNQVHHLAAGSIIFDIQKSGVLKHGGFLKSAPNYGSRLIGKAT